MSYVGGGRENDSVVRFVWAPWLAEVACNHDISLLPWPILTLECKSSGGEAKVLTLGL